MNVLIWSIGIIISFVLILVFNALFQATRLPYNHPNQFLRNKKPDKKTLVCVGDSITHGRIGTDYVAILREQLTEFNIVNAGINGHLVWNVNQRIDATIACEPDVVTILIGTNDANATLSEVNSNNYVKRYNLPQKANIGWFESNYINLIEEIQSRTDARIILLSLPTIGEDLNSEEFNVSIRYSEVIKKIASENNLEYLALNESMKNLLEEKENIYPIEKDETKMIIAIAKHYIFLKSWNKIAQESNFNFHIDYLHLNDEGAQLITNLISNIIN